MAAVYAGVMRRSSPASRGERRHDRILALRIVGPTWAAAEVQLSIGPKLFTDLLSFLKLDGRWQIVSKVFGYTTLPQGAGV
jgi:4-oxalocrotonate tautomerase